MPFLATLSIIQYSDSKTANKNTRKARAASTHIKLINLVFGFISKCWQHFSYFFAESLDNFSRFSNLSKENK